MNNKKNNAFLLPILLSSCLALGIWIGTALAPKTIGFQMGNGLSNIQKLQDVIDILDKRYVDTINANKLFEQTLADMLHKLDPHSNYIPAKELQAINESIEGKFGGIGVRFFILRDTICVTNVIKGSPSERVGLLSGDKIIRVDGKKVCGVKITNEKVMGMLKGTENTKVELEIMRNKKLLSKRITRGVIPIQSVSAAYMIAPGTGFVKIDEFSLTTADEFNFAVSSLLDQGMKRIIMDLRNNGGGVLESATRIADEFLTSGVPMLMTKGTHVGSKTYKATSGGMLEKMPVAVLINANSASASEILAGALQDNDRGTIVGRRSFGKGLVQEDMLLRDGSSLRLTIARYYTPTGRCIQRPYDEGYEKYMTDPLDQNESNAMFQPDTTSFNDSLRFKTPKGKIVYGGGGIMPDVFVPYDSSGVSWFYNELLFGQTFSAFAFDFVSGKRNAWKSAEQFEESFVVTPQLLNQFLRFVEKEFKLKRNIQEFEQSKQLISKMIKAEIARQIWLENGYFLVMNKEDKDVKRAMKLLTR
jgi:carboxyl-terminal processing protease